MLQTPTKVSKQQRNKQILKSYEKLMKKPEAMSTAVVGDVAQQFGITQRTVYNALKQVK